MTRDSRSSPPLLRIGIDLTAWRAGVPASRHAAALLRGLFAAAPQHEYVCLVERRAAATLESAWRGFAPPRLEWAPLDLAFPDAGVGTRRLLERGRLYRAAQHALRGERPRALLVTDLAAGCFAPPSIPVAALVHDPLPGTPTARGSGGGGAHARLRLSAARARLLICASTLAAEHTAKALGVPRERIAVVPPLPAAEFRAPLAAAELDAAREAAKLPAGARWFLHAGGTAPWENVGSLVRAHALLVRRRERPPYLVLVDDGSDGGPAAELRVAARAGGNEGYLRILARESDAALRGLYAGALACVLPAFRSGAALACLEAAACGTPCLATKESPLVDALAGAVRTFDPWDVGSLVAELEWMLDREREREALGAGARAAVQARSATDAGELLVGALARLARRAPRWPLFRSGRRPADG